MNRQAPARTVLILGTGPLEDAVAAVEAAAGLGDELVLLSLGYPVTRRQRALVTAAIELIAETHTGLDAVLVPDSGELPTHLRAEDRVAIFASGLELRRIERVVRSPSADDRAAGD